MILRKGSLWQRADDIDRQEKVQRRREQLEEQACEGERIQALALGRHRLRTFYKSLPFQYAVCIVVVVGFIIDMTEAQYLPDYGTDLYNGYVYCDVVFTALFTTEVLINMISCSTSRCPFIEPFFRKWLNIFDLRCAKRALKICQKSPTSPIKYL